MPDIEETTAGEHQPSQAMAEAATSRNISWAQMLRELLETIVLTVVIFLLIRNVVQNFRVEGSSMEPNLRNGQFLIVNRFAYCPGFHLDIGFLDIHWQKVWCVWEPQRGDVIVFHAPDQPKDYIKRVVGLPEETIEMHQGQVLINGQPLEEPYETRRNVISAPAVTLGPDELFVMGDNRPNSNDSRVWGTLSMEEVVGKALLRYWPPRDWAIIPHYRFASELTITLSNPFFPNGE